MFFKANPKTKKEVIAAKSPNAAPKIIIPLPKNVASPWIASGEVDFPVTPTATSINKMDKKNDSG